MVSGWCSFDGTTSSLLPCDKVDENDDTDDDDVDDDENDDDLGHDCLGSESFVHLKVSKLPLEP